LDIHGRDPVIHFVELFQNKIIELTEKSLEIVQNKKGLEDMFSTVIKVRSLSIEEHHLPHGNEYTLEMPREEYEWRDVIETVLHYGQKRCYLEFEWESHCYSQIKDVPSYVRVTVTMFSRAPDHIWLPKGVGKSDS
jgi:hypothetical protein